MDTLLNDGDDTTDDLPKRSVIVGAYTLILPTQTELRTLSTDQGNRSPPGWPSGGRYHSATRTDLDVHANVNIRNGQVLNESDTTTRFVAFQVIPPKNLLFRIKVFLEGAQ